jgi:hypothetical protein
MRTLKSIFQQLLTVYETGIKLQLFPAAPSRLCATFAESPAMINRIRGIIATLHDPTFSG